MIFSDDFMIIRKKKSEIRFYDLIRWFSLSKGEHFQQLQKLFDICVQESLKLAKCAFIETKVYFLDYKISSGCITPDNPNIKVNKI